MEALIQQYTGANEDARLVRQNIAKMEFDTTRHVLSEHLLGAKSVTELGAATGRYSLYYAEQGYQATAVELVQDQVNILKHKVQTANIALSIHEGDARHVPFIASASQDVVLVLGPLYHIADAAGRQSVIAEANQILKPNGVLAVAYISRFFVAGMFAQQFPELITPNVLDELLTQGTVSSELADSFFRVGYFDTPSGMEALLSEGGFSVCDHAATDGFGRYISAGVNAFSAEQYQVWLEYHLQTCREPSLLGSSNHGLIIGRKMEFERWKNT